MPTEIFTKKQFEDALPKDKVTGVCLWSEDYLGLPEYTYRVPISKRVSILVCSSIRIGQTTCDGTGENSIRAYLAGSDNKPIAPKLKRWTARTTNWRTNMRDLLRNLYRLGLRLESCPDCSRGPMRLAAAKTGSNKGRKYISCPKPPYGPGCGHFEWYEEELSKGAGK